jgi:hypothetical protein
MKNMKKTLLAALIVGAMASTSMATDVICGGQVPLINNIIGIGMTTLDFGSAGTAVECADLFINNNSATWDLTIECNTSGNGGQFENYAGTAIVPTLLEVRVGNLGGTLGTMGAGDAFAAINLIGPGGDWHYEQTTATQMYNLMVVASWAKSAALAGLYFETITATIIATL